MAVAKVVDASAIAAVLFGEPEGRAVSAALRDVELIAPALLDFEVANICITKMRRHPRSIPELAAGFALLRRMEIRRHPVDHLAVIALAEKTQLTAYDASYLWLARTFGIELVSLDKRLLAAAATPP